MSAEHDDLTVLGAFLARRDEPRPSRDHPADVLVLCGSAVLASLTLAAGLLHRGAVGRVLVTGGIGHSTPYLRDAVAAHALYRDTEAAGRTEADVIAELLRRHLDVPADSLLLETHATNCGQNAELSLRLLDERGGSASSLVIVQDPTMQRRTHASFEHWRRTDGPSLRSLAPFVPVVGEHGVGELSAPPRGPSHGSASWPWERSAG